MLRRPSPSQLHEGGLRGRAVAETCPPLPGWALRKVESSEGAGAVVVTMGLVILPDHYFRVTLTRVECHNSEGATS